MASVAELRSQVAGFLQTSFPPPEGPTGPAFSAFDRAQVEVATELAVRFGEIAAGSGDIDGVSDVLEAAVRETRHRSASLVKYALLIFLTHDPIGSQIGPPSLEQRHPSAVRGMAESSARRTAHDPTSLSFFREDVYANDHHAHWHQVYTSDYQRSERQGELFVYMHRQMLARYDHERLGVGRPAVEKLDLQAGVIEEGFDPRMAGFGVRDDNTVLPPDAALRQREEVFYAAIEQRLFRAALDQQMWNPELDISGPEPELAILAAALEAEGRPLRFEFGGLNLHNTGHRVIALVSHDEHGDPLRGAMWDPAIAIRDPVFWQWHKIIDDIAGAWEDAQPERDFSAPEDRGPQVEVLDPILCRRADVGGDFDDASDWAAATFGTSHWDEDFSATAPATGELLTHMTTRTGAEGDEIVYLDMADEFALVVRLDNPGDPVEVTLRVFLVADEWRDDRRRWIELDKFLHIVPTGRSVAYRPSSQSSVVRKPVTRPPGPPPPDVHAHGDAYCECGWPYNLLLPRGTTEGMRFRLLVLATDAAWDRDATDTCGSMSFCGLRDNRYPDKRSMGYPFERRLAGGASAALGALPNAGQRTFTIRCERLTPA